MSKISTIKHLFLTVVKTCKYLYHAINFALRENRCNCQIWCQLCDRSAEFVKGVEESDELPESDYLKNTWITGKTIMRWFHQFQKTRSQFPFQGK